MKKQFRLVLNLLLLLSILASPIVDSLSQVSPVRSDIIQPHPLNMDFEDGELGHLPTGWVSPVPKGFTIELTDENPKSGKRSVRLQSVDGVARDENSFGNIMQVIDATPYRGKRVRFRAAVRSEGSYQSVRAQLWMRVDRSERRPGFFDNMGDRAVMSRDWGYYDIVGDVDVDALTINIGMILLGSGKAWLDDASLVELGTPVTHSEPARALTNRGLENIVAFTQLLGYVRHFHPSDKAVATNWDAFAVEGIRRIENAKNPAELARTLELLFNPIAPTVRVFPTGKKQTTPFATPPQDDKASLKVVTWRHVGFGQTRSQRSPYRSQRINSDVTDAELAEKSGIPRKPFSSVLGGGVSCLVPMALFANARGTLPRATPSGSNGQPTMERYSGNDRATRLADVALTWNVMQHFYPYFDVVKTDWSQVLPVALRSAATDQNERAFLDTLRRMVAELHDGHGGVYHNSDTRTSSVPVLFGWVEGQLVVTDVAEKGAEGLQPGDVITKVEGKPSAEVLAELESLISGATPQWLRSRSLNVLRTGPKDSELRLEARRGQGEVRSVVLRRTIDPQSLREARPPKISELKPGIFYVDLDRVDDKDFETVLPQLAKATGIIFDLRGYPTGSPAPISHLIDKNVESARWNIPIITMPNRLNIVEYETSGRWTLEPIAPRLKARIAFITDGSAISYAESYMGIIEAYKLAEIVGETTAGTNGNINPILLPGDYRVSWTGMKVLKHDGSQHHGIGIRPTIPVSRTITGIAEKRDEQLERAVSAVSK